MAIEHSPCAGPMSHTEDTAGIQTHVALAFYRVERVGSHCQWSACADPMGILRIYYVLGMVLSAIYKLIHMILTTAPAVVITISILQKREQGLGILYNPI